ncbi:hypothetical protein [Demequina sp. NBRC 110054]|uniref:hypothetical protein n=1 Tax=Demequina sp. NBRC 110054 TaxID=1570343 RepID=UPI0009FFC087|nr:hypothetical protein [Demequina sp. NBRC 110054]
MATVTDEGSPAAAETRSALLGLDDRWVTLGAAVLASITMLQASTSTDAVRVPLLTGICIAIVATATIMVVQSAPDPYPLGVTVAMCVALSAGSVATTWNYATPQPGFAAWQLQASATVMLVLAIRGRIAWAWLGTAGVNAPTFVWAHVNGLPPSTAWAMTLPPVMLVGGASLYNRAIRGAIARVHAAEARQRELEIIEARAHLAAKLRDSAHQRVSALALPVLARAHRKRMDAALSEDAAAAESALRDAIHAPALTGGSLGEAVAAARRRGVAVMLRDDSGHQLSPSRAEAVTSAVLPLLQSTQDGRVVIRLAPPASRAHVTVRASGRRSASAEFRWDGEMLCQSSPSPTHE